MVILNEKLYEEYERANQCMFSELKEKDTKRGADPAPIEEAFKMEQRLPLFPVS
jgi:hypothetical protein